MLRALLICPDEELNEHLRPVMLDAESVEIARVLSHYPNAAELTRYVRAYAVNTVFITADSVKRVSECVDSIEKDTPGVQIVAIGYSCDPQLLIDLMGVGVRNFMAPPFSTRAVLELSERLESSLRIRPPATITTDQVFCFLPSKPGVGTSTIALNVSYGLTRRPDVTALLADLDLNSGMLRFMLKLQNERSILDAADHAGELDPSVWSQLVSKHDGLDVLHASEMNPDRRLEPKNLTNVLEFARRTYKYVCFDLSGNFERYSLDVMHESKRIYVVSTFEVGSLHLARERTRYLGKLGLRDRAQLILNRSPKVEQMKPKEIVDLVGIPIAATFANDYSGVQRALTAGKPVDVSTALGKQFHSFVDSLTDRKMPVEIRTKKRFLEFFAVAPLPVKKRY